MNKKITLVFIAGFFFLIAGGYLISSSPNLSPQTGPSSNVSVMDGTQIIEIQVRGGYSPRETYAQAGIPTVLKMETKGTLDCSSYVQIPSLNIQQSLPLSGIKEFEIPTQEAGTTLNGLCGMGMYNFKIHFENFSENF
ncbi:MAG: cupredoxin domain-containing protein [Candidatus Gracilibacteria bacterium]|jgi:plastocyanin domain-containing protein